MVKQHSWNYSVAACGGQDTAAALNTNQIPSPCNHMITACTQLLISASIDSLGRRKGSCDSTTTAMKHRETQLCPQLYTQASWDSENCRHVLCVCECMCVVCVKEWERERERAKRQEREVRAETAAKAISCSHEQVVYEAGCLCCRLGAYSLPGWRSAEVLNPREDLSQGINYYLYFKKLHRSFVHLTSWGRFIIINSTTLG